MKFLLMSSLKGASSEDAAKTSMLRAWDLGACFFLWGAGVWRKRMKVPTVGG